MKGLKVMSENIEKINEAAQGAVVVMDSGTGRRGIIDGLMSHGKVGSSIDALNDMYHRGFGLGEFVLNALSQSIVEDEYGSPSVVSAYLHSLTSEERKEAFSDFCIHCGDVKPEKAFCTCMMDD